MENTPFDSNEKIEFSNPIPAASPSPSPPRKAKVWLWLFLLLPILGLGGFWAYDQNLKRQEEARLLSIRQELKTLVLEDNALALGILELDKSSHITYAEYFKRTEKNKDERDDLIRRARAIEADIYAPQRDNFVKLLELENEWVRSDEAVSRAQIEATSRSAALDTALENRESSQSTLKSASDAYFQTPYGEDYDEKIEMEIAQTRLTSAQGQASEAFEQWSKASKEMREKQASARLATKDWLDNENRLYPFAFAPKRDIVSLLIKRKSKYGEDEVSSDSANSNASGSDATAPKVEIATSVEATPTPSVPTRLRSLSPFEGERFPQTRMEDLTPEFAYNLSDDDLRYAINEMYARFGMTFKDKDYQAQFEGFKWYQPNDAWTMPQITRAFSKREKANLAILSSERTARRSGL